jgi:hypothetical protein
MINLFKEDPATWSWLKRRPAVWGKGKIWHCLSLSKHIMILVLLCHVFDTAQIMDRISCVRFWSQRITVTFNVFPDNYLLSNRPPRMKIQK